MIEEIARKAILNQDESLLRQMLNLHNDIASIGDSLLAQADDRPIMLAIVEEKWRPITPISLSEVRRACYDGNLFYLNKLVEWGGHDFSCTLTCVARNSKVVSMELVERLIELGANDFDDALRSAAMNKHWPMFERMLEMGASNIDDILVNSYKCGQLELAKKLISYGAKVDWNNVTSGHTLKMTILGDVAFLTTYVWFNLQIDYILIVLIFDQYDDESVSSVTL